jgi:hypothetical protein
MIVRLPGKKGGKFFEVQTSVNGAHFCGDLSLRNTCSRSKF